VTKLEMLLFTKINTAMTPERMLQQSRRCQTQSKCQLSSWLITPKTSNQTQIKVRI